MACKAIAARRASASGASHHPTDADGFNGIFYGSEG